MKADGFREGMKQLAVMVGNDQAMELFNSSYEELLNEVKKETDLKVRTEQLSKMKLMTMHQAAYLMNLWLRAKRIQGMI
jgi:uncharacterized membrane protein